MSNDEYLRWQGLLYKVAKRYVGINSLYDLEDLVQIGAIGLAKGLETYDNKSDIPLKNWLANNVSWTIYREINKNRSIDTAMSLYMPLGDDEDSTLEEIIGDDNVNVQREAEDRIMLEYYYNLIREKLNKTQADVLIYKFFEDYSNKDIEEILNITGISNHIREARMTLIRRSKLFMAEYRRIRNLDDYSNPERVALI